MHDIFSIKGKGADMKLTKLTKPEENALNQYYLFGYWKNRGSMKLKNRRKLLNTLSNYGYLNDSGITKLGIDYCVYNR